MQGGWISSAGVEQVRTFVGHSGCEVALCRIEDTYFVRKRSASPAYNARFRRQIAKQVALSAVLRTPRVLRSGEENGLVAFDMEYVSGEDFRSYAPYQNIAFIGVLVEHIITAMSRLAADQNGSVPVAEFGRKLDELTTTVPQSPFFAAHEAMLTALLQRLLGTDWNGIPQSECHGDLTLENILICGGGELVFIDPLDGEMSSVWMDFAKLTQDLSSGWSLRELLAENPLPPEGRLLHMLTRYLLDELNIRIAEEFPGLLARLPQLRALQALRVLPYVKEPELFERVVTGIARIEWDRSAHV